MGNFIEGKFSSFVGGMREKGKNEKFCEVVKCYLIVGTGETCLPASAKIITKQKLVGILILILLLIETNSAFCMPKDSSNVFKISVGASYTQWKADANIIYYPGYFSHFSSSDSKLQYIETTNYSPVINISFEHRANKHVGFYCNLNYCQSKLSYHTDSTSHYYNPNPPPNSNYYESHASYKITPNNFMFSAGLKLNAAGFYVVPKVNIYYSIAKAKVNDTITSTAYPATIITNRKEIFSKGGLGFGVLLGYEFKSKHFSLFTEFHYNPTLNALKLNLISYCFLIGIKI